MDVFCFCSGADETCSKEDCHKAGGCCEHTIDRAFARETESVRLFEEVDPGALFEIDPDALTASKSDTPNFFRRLAHAAGK